MREKWKRRGGWIKIHISVNTKTGEVVSMESTTEKVGDSRMFDSLINESEEMWEK